MVPGSVWSAHLVCFQESSRPPCAKADTVNFVHIHFCHLHLDDDMFSHLVMLPKNQAGQNLEQDENRLSAHSRDVIGSQRN